MVLKRDLDRGFMRTVLCSEERQCALDRDDILHSEGVRYTKFTHRQTVVGEYSPRGLHLSIIITAVRGSP